jgi:hypothetical protein
MRPLMTRSWLRGCVRAPVGAFEFAITVGPCVRRSDAWSLTKMFPESRDNVLSGPSLSDPTRVVLDLTLIGTTPWCAFREGELRARSKTYCNSQQERRTPHCRHAALAGRHTSNDVDRDDSLRLEAHLRVRGPPHADAIVSITSK